MLPPSVAFPRWRLRERPGWKLDPGSRTTSPGISTGGKKKKKADALTALPGAALGTSPSVNRGVKLYTNVAYFYAFP